MPFLYNLAFEEEPSLQYLNDIYSSIILKDITQRNKIRDTDLLERVINYLTISSKKSPTSISRGWIAFLVSWNCFKNMIWLNQLKIIKKSIFGVEVI